MPGTPSILNLHLRYRLWIAELNFDITVLRIFDDYLSELQSKKINVPDVINGIIEYKRIFIDLRKEIDELRHDMHLNKMKLAAATRDNKPLKDKISSLENHNTIKSHYASYRKKFSQFKKEFGQFEGTWLN